ncbi:MAG TPA: hypothetical protein VKT25_10080 [Ktedonobacteraceae bacterium]|nr:hypothetical protein [Ktedonobacteraceae bacterium]
MAINVSRETRIAMQQQLDEAKDIKHTMTGRSLPNGWEGRQINEDTAYFYNPITRMKIIETVAPPGIYGDPRRWHHVSVSFPDRLPDWSDLEMVKRVWMGHEVTALQVIPPVRKYVNLHAYCLHLWRCLDGDVTPDFSTVIDGIRHV